jgi:hypothetical protein
MQADPSMRRMAQLFLIFLLEPGIRSVARGRPHRRHSRLIASPWYAIEPLIHHADPSRPVSHYYSAGLGRLRLDEIEREPFVHTAEKRLAFAEDDRVNNQPEFIDQVLVK